MVTGIELWKKSAEINFKIKFYKDVCTACEYIDSIGEHSLKTWKFWLNLESMHWYFAEFKADQT